MVAKYHPLAWDFAKQKSYSKGDVRLHRHVGVINKYYNWTIGRRVGA